MRQQELLFTDCVQTMLTVMLLLLAGMPEGVAFQAYDWNNQSTQIELLDPEQCGNMEKVQAIEQKLNGEIVKIKKECLVQVTRCTASQTIKLAYCGFQSCSGVERYEKFQEPIVIEPADCRLAAKTWKFKLNGKKYPCEMNVRRSVIVNLVGGLDNNGNCEVGMF
jgi:hypothetical protein